MKTVGKMVLTLVALLSIAATASAATDKLLVKNGTSSVFAVQDTGLTTINGTTADTSNILQINDLAGTPALFFSPQGFFNLAGGSGSKVQMTTTMYAGTDGVSTSAPNQRPVYEAYRARGSKASPAKVMLNDKLGTFGFAGYDGSGNVDTGKISAALLEVFVDGPVATGSVPQRMSIVTGSSSAARAERLVVKSDGKIGIGTNAPTSILQVVGLPVYADNTAAKAANLTDGAIYRTPAGVLMVVYTP